MIPNKKQSARGFFDEQDALEKLSKLKDPLEKLNKHIDFEVFRETPLSQASSLVIPNPK